MATNYPSSLDTTAELPANSGVGAQLSTFPHSELHGNTNDAVRAIEAELGTDPSAGFSTVKTRIASIEDDMFSAYEAPAYGTGWEDAASRYPLRIKKIGNVAFLIGGLVRTSGAATVALTLPVGYRPSEEFRFLVHSGEEGDIGTNGEVEFDTGVSNGDTIFLHMPYPIDA